MLLAAAVEDDRGEGVLGSLLRGSAVLAAAAARDEELLKAVGVELCPDEDEEYVAMLEAFKLI
jgi:hypothetical protein